MRIYILINPYHTIMNSLTISSTQETADKNAIPQVPPKQALLDILDVFLSILEMDVFSDNRIDRIMQETIELQRLMLEITALGNQGVPNDSLDEYFDTDYQKQKKQTISSFTQDIDNLMQKYFHDYWYDDFRKIFSREQYFAYLPEWNAKAETNRLIKVIAHIEALRTRDHGEYSWHTDAVRRGCEGKLEELSRKSPNVLGYMVFRAFMEFIRGARQDWEIFNSVQILLDSSLIQWSSLEGWIHDFLKNYTSSLSSSQIWSTLTHSSDWEQTIAQISSFPETSDTRFEVYANILCSKKVRKFDLYRKQAFDGCMAYMAKIPPEHQVNLWQGKLEDVYQYYLEHEEEYSLEEQNIVSKAFERYSENYSEYLDFSWLYFRSLPVPLIKKAARGEIKVILWSIQDEREMRKKRTEKSSSDLPKPLRELHYHAGSPEECSYLTYCVWNDSDIFHEPMSHIVPNNTSHPDWHAVGESDSGVIDWTEYYRLKRMRPERTSNDADELRDIRKNLRYTTDPLAARQWLYRTLVTRICGYYKWAPWPRFDSGEMYDQTRDYQYKSQKPQAKITVEEISNNTPPVAPNDDFDNDIPF